MSYRTVFQRPKAGSLLLLLMLCLYGLPLHAAVTPPLILTGPVDAIRLEPHSSFFCDPGGTLTLAQVQKTPFAPLAHPTIVFGFREGACWFHFRLENHGSVTLPLIFQINYPPLDRIELYAPDNKIRAYWLMGDAQAFSARPLVTRSYNIPLTLDAGQQQDYFLRIASTSSFNVPMLLMSPESFASQHEVEEWLQGAGFGITFGLIIYHLFLWLAVREKVYRFYILYIASAFSYLLCFEGMAYRFWPDSPHWNNHAQLLFIFLMLGASALFTRDYLATHLWRSADRVLQAIAAASIGLSALQFLLPLGLGYKLQPVLAIITMIAIVSIALVRLHEGMQEARLLLLAWGLLILMATAVSLQSFGLFPGRPILITLNGMAITFILQQLLLALALANRLNILKAERQKQEQAIVRAEAENAAKTEFLAKMSHEIRTPMNALLGITQLLQDTTMDETQKNYVDTLYSSGHALLNIINDILDYSRIASGKVELEMVDFNLLDLLDECIQVFSLTAREKSLSLVCERSRDLPTYVRGDSGRLRQVLLNLLSNAIKFTEYGNVFLRASVEDASSTHVQLRFEVEDSGIGIAPEKIPGLFESFVQADSSTSREYGGSGLGLAISKQLVELMHGRILASSQPGKGTIFRFNVLLEIASANTATPASGQTASSPKMFAGVQALVVEDNPINQLVINGFLQKIGIKARMASSGQEALDILERDEDGFNLVFMDCEMPFMDGFETTRRLRLWEQQNRRKPLHIIALTAHALPQHRQQCLLAGMDDYLSKPLLLSKLIEKLHSVLG